MTQPGEVAKTVGGIFTCKIFDRKIILCTVDAVKWKTQDLIGKHERYEYEKSKANSLDINAVMRDILWLRGWTGQCVQRASVGNDLLRESIVGQ